MSVEREEVVETELEEPVEAPLEQVEEPAKEPSVHETVAAAFEAVEDYEEKELAEAEGREPRTRDPETGQFVKEGKPKVKPAAAAAPKVPVKPGQAPVKPVPKAAPLEDPLARAPQAWRALEREQWKVLDKLGEDGKAIKDAILRREREVNQRLQQDAPARDLASQFERVVSPFLNLIPPGKSPLESIHGLMQTAAVLQTGSPQQRAIVAANIIRGYGIDIDMLATALDGRQNVAGPGTMPANGGAYDPRVDQLVAELRARDQQQQQWMAQQEEAELEGIRAGYEEFAKNHEFFEDVREEMADLIRVAAERGIAMDDETAYSRAVSFHPELEQLQRQREVVEEARNPSGSTAASRRAAVSLRPRPSSRPSNAVPATDLRGTVAAAMDKVLGNRS